MVQNFTRDWDETESLIYFRLETETRPKLSQISDILLIPCDYQNLKLPQSEFGPAQSLSLSPLDAMNNRNQTGYEILYIF